MFAIRKIFTTSNGVQVTSWWAGHAFGSIVVRKTFEAKDEAEWEKDYKAWIFIGASRPYALHEPGDDFKIHSIEVVEI